MVEPAQFSDLSPDLVIDCVEAALEKPFSGLAFPYPSYINRVYEVMSEEGERFIVKFYRPDRWSSAAILEEHDFLMDLEEAEVPVVPPLLIQGETTLIRVEGFPFAVFPKRAGRGFEATDPESYRRLGAMVGRMHLVGSKYDAPNRVKYTPETALSYLQELAEADLIPVQFEMTFQKLITHLIEKIAESFTDVNPIRIHGDLHRANILDRMDQGLLFIDFDDMMTGPPVQDLWLLLPDYKEKSQKEISYLLDGYTSVYDFDYASLSLIEPLRAMRMIYFLAWQARQRNDVAFKHNFPYWGTEGFWQKEIIDLQEQLDRF